jgi:predicted porin
MNRTFIAAAVLGSFAGLASAQSTVTVWGVLDQAMRSVKNGSAGTLRTLSSDGEAANQLGFRGSEDLGGGTTARFWLESQLFPDTGAAGSSSLAGQFFNRRSFVALSNTKVGEVRLGRDYVPTHYVQCSFDPFGCVGLGQSPQFRSSTGTAINDAFGSTATKQNTLTRGNNSVSYHLPSNLGGFTGMAMVQAGEGAADSSTGASKASGGSLGYAAGPIYLAGAFYNTKNTLVAKQTFKDAAFAVSYDLGFAKAGLVWRSYRYINARLDSVSVALSAPVGTAGVVKAMYIRANQRGTSAAGVNIDANDSTMLALGYTYDLSKRTALYGHVASLANKGNAAFTLPSGPAGIKAGETSSGYEIGIRHVF